MINIQDIQPDLQKERKGKSDFVIIEGFHALKHAIRFGAEIDVIYISASTKIDELGETVRDDEILDMINSRAKKLSQEEFTKLAPRAARTGVLARAKKNVSHGKAGDKIVLLENPRDIENVGAVVRVCAARGIGALVTTGEISPWHANCIRAAAGLHWALDIYHEKNPADAFERFDSHSVVACTDEGQNMYQTDLPEKCILVFGTEREGISTEVREQSDLKYAIPMQEGVSSMNLATSVAAILFS